MVTVAFPVTPVTEYTPSSTLAATPFEMLGSSTSL